MVKLFVSELVIATSSLVVVATINERKKEKLSDSREVCVGTGQSSLDEG